MPRLSASKTERLVLIIMGIILVVSLGVLFVRDRNNGIPKINEEHLHLPEDGDGDDPEANAGQPE